MNDPQTFWLTVTNAAMGIGVAACVLYVVLGTAYDLVIRARKRHRLRAELERDISALSESPAWNTPGQYQPTTER